jgi:phosphocarrier protein HPr
VSASCEGTARLPAGVALHARPAGALARQAMGYSSQITVTADGRAADAKSVLRVMALGAEGGTSVTVRAEGEDAADAVAGLVELIEQLSA